MKIVLVCGAAGFIGSHLVKRLRKEGSYVIGVDKQLYPFGQLEANEFHLVDLTIPDQVEKLFSFNRIDEVYQLAADMGGAGYIFSGFNDTKVMLNSSSININIIRNCIKYSTKKIFFSSSACVYPSHNQIDPLNPFCEESTAYPANPDSEYGWEKLYAERMYLAARRNFELDCRIARLHNVFGPYSSFSGGKEKAPAAICRKVAESRENGSIDIWGDGTQTRSFLYVDECVEGILRLMESNYFYPINIGSEEMISIKDLAEMIISISGKNLSINYIYGPIGVNGRNSHNELIHSVLNWSPSLSLSTGIEITYRWIESNVNKTIN